MAEIANVYGDADFGGVPLAGGDEHFADVGPGFAEDGAEVGEKALAVDGDDGEVYTEEAVVRFPLDGGDALGFAIHEGDRVGAHAAVDEDAASTTDVADDIIAGDGLAAGGATDKDVRVACADGGGGFAGADLDGWGRAGGADDATEAVHDAADADEPFADAGEEVEGGVHVFEVLEDGFDGVVAGEGAGVEALAFDFGGDGVFPPGGVVALVLAAEIGADFGFGVLRGDELEPVEARRGIAAGDELDDVAVLEPGVDFPDDPVDFCADDAQTEIRVDAEGEVNGGGVDGHVEDVALGGEDEDLLAEEVHADGAEEVAGGDGVGGPVEELPAEVFEGFGLGDFLGAFFVRPVGGDAELGDFVHVAGADLDFDGVATWADDFGVEALVAVRLGGGDVVAEEALHGQEKGVGIAKSAVAVVFGLDDDTDRDEVKDLLEGDALLDDLVVDAVEVLGAADDLDVF